jgi:hypothetical protein
VARDDLCQAARTEPQGEDREEVAVASEIEFLGGCAQAVISLRAGGVPQDRDDGVGGTTAARNDDHGAALPNVAADFLQGH